MPIQLQPIDSHFLFRERPIKIEQIRTGPNAAVLSQPVFLSPTLLKAPENTRKNLKLLMRETQQYTGDRGVHSQKKEVRLKPETPPSLATP